MTIERKYWMINSTETAGAPNPDDGDISLILDRIRRCVETISQGFGRWGDEQRRGPGLYFVVTDSGTEFSDPMGSNRWPVEECESVLEDSETVEQTARTVALTRDGAVIVRQDGAIEERMVRIRQLFEAELARVGVLPFAEWMGARHMSALETSTREEVVSTITLSEEDGRVTVFTDGAYEDFPRDELEGERETRQSGPTASKEGIDSQ